MKQNKYVVKRASDNFYFKSYIPYVEYAVPQKTFVEKQKNAHVFYNEVDARTVLDHLTLQDGGQYRLVKIKKKNPCDIFYRVSKNPQHENNKCVGGFGESDCFESGSAYFCTYCKEESEKIYKNKPGEEIRLSYEDEEMLKQETRKVSSNVIETWIRDLYPEGCVIDINPNMNEFKVSSKTIISGDPLISYDHGSLYNSLHALEEDVARCGLVHPKSGTVFTYNGFTYVITSIEKIDQKECVFVTSKGWKEPNCWRSLKEYYDAKSKGNVKIIWEPKK